MDNQATPVGAASLSGEGIEFVSSRAINVIETTVLRPTKEGKQKITYYSTFGGRVLAELIGETVSPPAGASNILG